MTRAARCVLFCAVVAGWLAAPSSAQITIYTVANGVTTPVGQVYDFGPVTVGSGVDVVFNIQYSGSGSTFYLTYFSLAAGAGFLVTQTDWQELPAAVPVTGLNFTVHFQPTQVGSYSANLQLNQTDGVSAILIGNGVAGLSLMENSQALSAGQTIVFPNSVQTGSTGTLQLALANQTTEALTVPAVTVSGNGFSLTGASPSGATVSAGTSLTFALAFAPTVAGTQFGQISLGTLSYPLQATAVAATVPNWPLPSIAVSPATVLSAAQGAVAISLASAAPQNATGTLTMTFQPSAAGVADDPSITFADGTRTATFTVTQGNTACQFATGSSVQFQTGTTAGVIGFSGQMEGQTAAANVTIAPAEVGIDAAVAARNVACVVNETYCTATNVELQINGWDNTRTAGQVVFTFYNQSGTEISPGSIPWDGSTAFEQYFAGSTLGGVFSLDGVFPITGNSDDVTSAVVTFTNSAGTAQTQKIEF